MAWPLASQFSAMMQKPEIAFRDPELRRYSVEKDRFRQPRPWAGSFAVVYKGLPPDDGPPRAIRVFTSESPERRERYDAISDYLKTRRVGCLVDFEYRDESVRAAGDPKWYPLILMDWVQGDTLFKWAGARCRAGDKRALAGAAVRWMDLVAELEDARIAHGDLQHANVMVQPDEQLKLVDYDGMCVPALVGRRNLEVGVEPYQHPERNPQTLLALDLDRYSAMVVYVALRALAADPELWRKYVDEPDYDKLLFRKEDLQSPEAGPLIADLRASPDPEVSDLIEQLLGLAGVPLHEVGPLRQLASPSFARVERLLAAEQWEAAVEALNRRGRFRDAPRNLRPLIEQAYKHVCRKEAWEEFTKIPRAAIERHDRELVEAWNEPLFAGFEPAEQDRPRVDEARRRVAILDRLAGIVRKIGAVATLEGETALAEAAEGLPPGYQYGLAPRVEKARKCLGAIGHLETVLGQPASEAEIVAAWRSVVSLGCEGLVDDRYRPRIVLALRRLPLLASLRQIPDDLRPDERDARLLDVWQADLLGGCVEAEPWRSNYEQAIERRTILADLERAIHARDDGEVVRLLELPCLAVYPLPAAWSASIGAAQGRMAKTEALVAALRNGDRTAFVQAFDARLVRRYPARFAPYESALSQWTRKEILPAERLGLRPAVARASLLCEDRDAGVYRVRWTWPQQRFADECILAVCPAQPGAEDDPREIDVFHRVPLDRESWESGGGSRLIHTRPEWAGGWVVVWALVDLGSCRLASHPLVLGRLDAAPNGFVRFWRGWRLRRQKPGRQAELSASRDSTDDATEGRR